METAISNGSARAGRWAGVEWLRLLGCVAIVLFHARCPGEQQFLAGLHVFVILTTAMSVAGGQGRGLGEAVARRARSLLVPWLFWSVGYGAVKAYMAHTRGDGLFSWCTAGMVAVGPSIHLWFLPFAFAASSMTGAAARTSLAGPGSGRAAVWSVGAALVYWGANRLLSHGGWGQGLPAPLPQYLSVAGDVLLGAAIGSIAAARPQEWPGMVTVTLPSIAALAVGGALDGDAIAWPAGIAVAVTGAAWVIPARARPRLLAWSRTAYGVYLLHPLAALLTYKAWSVFALDRAVVIADSRWVLAAVVLAASFAATAALLRTPIRTFLS